VTNERQHTVLVLDQPTPTLFVDYDGTLHRGHGFIDENGLVTLDSGHPPFEYSPLLARLLEPYPGVQIVLTTRWLEMLPLERVVSFLPPELARRVVGTTAGIKVRFGYLKSGIDRTYVIRSYVFAKRLKNWLAIDDSVYGAFDLRTDFLDLDEHLVLLDPKKGIGDAAAQQRIEQWLLDVHGNAPAFRAPTTTESTSPAQMRVVEVNLPPEEHYPDDDVSDADIRTETLANRRQLLADGLLLTFAELQSALSMSEQELRNAMQCKQFFTVDVDGVDYYPAFFADSKIDRQMFACVLEELDSLPGWAKWCFFRSALESLGDAGVLDALACGKVMLVREAAKRFSEENDS
jgi:hypothetical protein